MTVRRRRTVAVVLCALPAACGFVAHASLSGGGALLPRSVVRVAETEDVEEATSSATTTTQVHSILDSDCDSAGHLGDIGGSNLDTDLSLSSGEIQFTPLQRIVLTANGNLQRILSAYHDKKVTVEVLENERVKIGLWRRHVRISVDGRAACIASSVVTARTRLAIEMADSGGLGIAQIFTELGGRQDFALLEVSKNAATFARTYTLDNPHIMCHIEEVFPNNLFDDDFFTAPPLWHPSAMPTDDAGS